jgi:aryl-alcohol dehydrogenase-like predicted oxidoreductase
MPELSSSIHPQSGAEMPTAVLGRTGLVVSRLALGTVELGLDYGIPAPGHFGKPDPTQAVRLVHAALDAGINLIDTARAYGSSESVLGRALQGRRDQVVLASKVATQTGERLSSPQALRTHMLASLDASLSALSVDWLDIWQIHNVDAHTFAHLDAIAQVFDEARQAGKIRFSGGSFYGADLPTQALTATHQGLRAAHVFDVMQVTFSVLDQRILDLFVPQAEAENMGLIIRSILLKGALTERAKYLPDHLEPLRAASTGFRQLVNQHMPDVTAPQAAIAFGLAHPQLHTVLVGVRTPEEIAENVHAAQLTLAPEFVDACRTLRIDDPDLLNPGTWGIP